MGISHLVQFQPLHQQRPRMHSNVRQKMIRSILIFTAALLATSFGDPSSPQPVENIRWGQKTEDSIEVRVWGDVAYQGIYHVPKGFGLKSILAVAGGLGWQEQRNHFAEGGGQFAGKIVISKIEDGKIVNRFETKLRILQMAATPDQELLDGDVIRLPNIKLWEK